MPEQPETEQERRRLYMAERLSAIEKSLDGRGGVLERLEHLDDCQDDMKKTLAEAVGGIKTAIWVVGSVLSMLVVGVNWYFSMRGHL